MTCSRLRSTRFFTIGALFVVAGCGEGAVEETTEVGTLSGALTSDRDASEATAAIMRLAPSARVEARAGRVSRIIGANLATGDTPEQATEAFRVRYASALGAQADDLQPAEVDAGKPQIGKEARPIGLMYDQATGNYKFWLYRYQQVRDGVPVHQAHLLTLVRNEPGAPVVWANSTLRDLGQFTAASRAATPRAVDRNKSVRAMRPVAGAGAKMMAPPTGLANYSQPEYVIYAGSGDQTQAPRLAVKYQGWSDSPMARWAFIADANTGDILQAENMIHFAIPGKVRGNATSGNAASECEAEVSMPIPYADLAVQGTFRGQTNKAGNFNLTHWGTTPVDVSSTLKGKYFEISNGGGADAELHQTVTPPNFTSFMHNQANTQEFERGQVNAYVGLNQVRDFLLSYLPDYPTIPGERRIWTTVNMAPPGNPFCPGQAAWNPGEEASMWFCAAGMDLDDDSWSNSAFSSILHHEFGHHIVDRGGAREGGPQKEYGEGMADTIAVLIADSPMVGRGFRLNQCAGSLRSADNDCQYSAASCATGTATYCGSYTDFHECGQLLSGIVWDIREALVVTEPADYQDILSAIVLSSIPMHGTSSTIDPSLAGDFLTLDDNDGNIFNGTPHTAEICAGFQAHGIVCPPPTPPSPCASFCANPTSFSWTGSYQSGNLGTGAICRETMHPVAGGNCGNFTGGRTLSVNGVTKVCNGSNWVNIPTPVNGGYCVTTTAGQWDSAFFTLW